MKRVNLKILKSSIAMGNYEVHLLYCQPFKFAYIDDLTLKLIEVIDGGYMLVSIVVPVYNEEENIAIFTMP